MDLGLCGKRALVTASSSGLGFAAASRLAREGCSVVLHARGAKMLRAAAAAIDRETGTPPSLLQADLAVAADVERLAKDALATLGGLDILVVNSGFHSLRAEPWWRSTGAPRQSARPPAMRWSGCAALSRVPLPSGSSRPQKPIRFDGDVVSTARTAGLIQSKECCHDRRGAWSLRTRGSGSPNAPAHRERFPKRAVLVHVLPNEGDVYQTAPGAIALGHSVAPCQAASR